MKRIDDLALIDVRRIGAKVFGFIACLMLAGCFGGGSSPEDIVAELPDEIIPIVIENEDEIREIIDTELDEDLQEDANEIVDLIVAVTTTTVSATTISATAGTD